MRMPPAEIEASEQIEERMRADYEVEGILEAMLKWIKTW